MPEKFRHHQWKERPQFSRTCSFRSSSEIQSKDTKVNFTTLKVRRPVSKTPKNKRSVPNFWTPKVMLILKEHKLEL